MKKPNNSILTQFRTGHGGFKAIPCEVVVGIRPGVYPSFSSAAKANRVNRKTLFDIAHGKFKREGIEVKLLDGY